MANENSLSEQRSREDMDLLERSTKKTKTDQNTPMMEAPSMDEPDEGRSKIRMDAGRSESRESQPVTGDMKRMPYRESLSGRRINIETQEKEKVEREKEVSDDEESIVKRTVTAQP